MLGSSWKVKLFALGVMALGFAGPVLNHYLPVALLNWNTVLDSAAVILSGGGLMLAKQYDVHGGTVDTGVRPAEVPITVAPPLPGAVPMPTPSVNRKGVQREDLP
jgi:hypothetical protein